MDETLLSAENEANMTKATEASLCYENEQTKSKDKKTLIISAICQNLKEIIRDNRNFENLVSKDLFYLKTIPDISLSDYIKRLVKHTNMNISTLINAIIYIDNLCENFKYILCMNNVYFLLLSSCLLSIKFNEDIPVNLKTYSQIAGVSVDKLKKLESCLYFSLNFGLFVKEDLYQEYFDYFSNYEFQNSKKGKEL